MTGRKLYMVFIDLEKNVWQCPKRCSLVGFEKKMCSRKRRLRMLCRYLVEHLRDGISNEMIYEMTTVEKVEVLCAGNVLNLPIVLKLMKK